MERNHIIGIILLIIVICCIPFWAWTKTVAGVGEYDFGADITENQSCDKALTNAEADAIERHISSCHRMLPELTQRLNDEELDDMIKVSTRSVWLIYYRKMRKHLNSILQRNIVLL